MRHIAFINENTLGHASYLVPYVRWFERHPRLELTPHLLNATPLPPALATRANLTVPGLRGFGLDFHATRWRLAVSRHVRAQVDELRRRQPLDALVVNTQSVALELADLAQEMPVFVCLDATFTQLARSRWFAPNMLARLLQPVTLATLWRKERELFRAARALLPWSERAEFSLVEDCGVEPERIFRLPPSVIPPPRPRAARREHQLPQVLFVGGDFKRKGGPLLLECFHQHLTGACELHIVTESDVAPEEGVVVHRGVKAGSDAWRERWEQADLFVFPSTLETFGIVLVEALAFQVPVVASDVGAAPEVLDDGDAGWLLPDVNPRALAAAIREALSQPAEAALRARRGRRIVERQFNLEANARRLAIMLGAGRA